MIYDLSPISNRSESSLSATPDKPRVRMARRRCDELERCGIVIDAFGADVGDAIALGVAGARMRLPRQISAHAVGRRQAGPFADQNHDAFGGERGGDGVAGGDPAVTDDDERCDL